MCGDVMEMTIALIIAYDGSRFSGWQRQHSLRTVQGVIEEALFKLLGTSITIHASGRTDAGVHAYGQCASFTADIKMPIEAFKLALNRRLPKDVKIISVHKMASTFHARYDAIGKTYVYKIVNNQYEDPFLSAFMTFVAKPLDEKSIREAMMYFCGTHDFIGFKASGSMVKSTIRTIHDFELQVKDNIWTFTINGDGFLYNMVRIIIGLLIRVGHHHIDPKSIESIISSKDREKAKWTAPPNGLYLKDVSYPEEIQKNFKIDIDKSH